MQQAWALTLYAFPEEDMELYIWRFGNGYPHDQKISRTKKTKKNY